MRRTSAYLSRYGVYRILIEDREDMKLTCEKFVGLIKLRWKVWQRDGPRLCAADHLARMWGGSCIVIMGS